ncbi:MAG: DinB family protein [Bacteroidota bacterium]
MAVFSKKQFLLELIDRTELVRSTTKSFLRLSNEQLNTKPAPGKWCIAEIFEHLCITQDIYIKLILPQISGAPDKDTPTHKSTWLGEFAYAQIKPKPDGKGFKLPSPKKLHPKNDYKDGYTVLNNFLHQLDIMHDILEHANTKDTQQIKIPFAFSKLITLRLGDNLRFLIAHNERHMLQAQRIAEIVDTNN